LKLLVKLGGTLLDSEDSRGRLAAELAGVQKDGVRLVVVHGGGKQMTRFLAERGIESKFIAGLRVTTPEVIDAVLKVFAGSVNHELVASLVAAGASAVGLSGIDAALTEAEPMHAELGAVGRPVRSNARLLEVLIENGYLPVVACVAGDRSGRIYNVNADQMAVACAAGFSADRLLFLTDVEGVRGADNTVLPSLTRFDCERLIQDQVATGGMQAKLHAAMDALAGGVGRVIIAPGTLKDVVGRLLAEERIGTQVVPGEGATSGA
jgi:acetylglutamate kinase